MLYLCPHQCHPSKVVDAACLAAGPAGHTGVTAATVLSEGRGWHEDKMLNVAADVLKRVPEVVDYEATFKLVSCDMGPLNMVLLQVCVYGVCMCGVVWCRTSTPSPLPLPPPLPLLMWCGVERAPPAPCLCYGTRQSCPISQMDWGGEPLSASSPRGPLIQLVQAFPRG